MSKQLIGLEYGAYTFDPANQKITLTDLAPINLKQILLITNVTDGIIIYNFLESNRGGAITSNVLTLDFDVSAMSASDELQIFAEYPPKVKARTYNSIPQTTVTVGNQATIFDSDTYSLVSGEVDSIVIKVSHMGFDIEVVVDDEQAYRVSLKELLLDYKLVDTNTRYRTNSEGTVFIDEPRIPLLFFKRLKIIAHNFYPWFGDGVVGGVLVGGRFV